MSSPLFHYSQSPKSKSRLPSSLHSNFRIPSELLGSLTTGGDGSPGGKLNQATSFLAVTLRIYLLLGWTTTRSQRDEDRKLNFKIVPTQMDSEAAKTARESLDLAFHMSNLLDTGLDRHTLSVLVSLCDLGLNPEPLAAVVKELHREPSLSSSSPLPPTSSQPNP